MHPLHDRNDLRVLRQHLFLDVMAIHQLGQNARVDSIDHDMPIHYGKGIYADPGAEAEHGHDHITLANPLSIEHAGVNMAKLGLIFGCIENFNWSAGGTGGHVHPLGFLNWNCQHAAPGRMGFLIFA